MLKTAARLLLLRVLPRRIVPIVTVVEALLFLRGIRNRSRSKRNAPIASRTAPPLRPGPDWAAPPASPIALARVDGPLAGPPET
jgi:hypothetical protein